MTQLNIVRVQNREALASPVLSALFDEAFKDGRPTDGRTAHEIFSASTPNARVLILVGLEEFVPKALALVTAPMSGLFKAPQIYHFFNAGPPALRNMMLDEVVDWTHALGYNRIWGVNWGSASEDGFRRVFHRLGKATPIGMGFEFELPERMPEAA